MSVFGLGYGCFLAVDFAMVASQPTYTNTSTQTYIHTHIHTYTLTRALA